MPWWENLLLNLVRLPTQWLVKTKVIPGDIEHELGISNDKPILYLLRTHSATDQIALAMAAKQLGLPDPLQQLDDVAVKQRRCVSLEQPQTVIGSRMQATDIAPRLSRFFQLHREDEQMDYQIVPVSVFWGRAPGKSKPGWSDLIADRASPSWLRKFFIVLFLGRDNFVVFSKAVSSRTMMLARDTDTDSQLAHKLIRVARGHFYRRRQAFVGPTQIDRSQLFNAVLASEAVKKAIQEEAESKKQTLEGARLAARDYIEEIAADYREGLIRIADRILTKVWNKIYNGIRVSHAERVRELAEQGHEIVYVPCHRSHMDYLLLTYVIYHEGLATPHIAAGINLNFWPIGGIFRRGGAFFIRRTFAGNKLYTAVFREYLEQLFNRGYPVKFYPEGGRSRTGRLLPPKTGMLAMTLQSAIKGVSRPVTLVPVSIAYEHVLEVGSYLKELKGSGKEKESIFRLFHVVRKLKNYGTGLLSFGEPISVTGYLDAKVPNWREAQQLDPDKKPSWLTPTVNALGNNIMLRINQTSPVSGLALVSSLLLASKRKTMAEGELLLGIEHLLALFTQAPFSALISLPKGSPQQILDNCLALNKFNITTDSFGRLVSLTPNMAVAQTYYRNNILHLFAIPGLIAAIVLAHRGLEKAKILAQLESLYPLLSRELFIYLSKEEAVAYAEQVITAMKDIGLLRSQGRKLQAPEVTTKAFYSLWLINRTIQETLQRYTLVLALLDKEQRIQRGVLEKRSRQLAERLSALHGINAPEFYDKNVLATFINALRDNQWIDADEAGLLNYTENSAQLQRMVLNLISPDIAQSIQRIQIL